MKERIVVVGDPAPEERKNPLPIPRVDEPGCEPHEPTSITKRQSRQPLRGELLGPGDDPFRPLERRGAGARLPERDPFRFERMKLSGDHQPLDRRELGHDPLSNARISRYRSTYSSAMRRDENLVNAASRQASASMLSSR